MKGPFITVSWITHGSNMVYVVMGVLSRRGDCVRWINGRIRVGLHWSYKARCFIRLQTVLSPAYTFPGGDPRIRDTMASLAILMFWKEPMI